MVHFIFHICCSRLLRNRCSVVSNRDNMHRFRFCLVVGSWSSRYGIRCLIKKKHTFIQTSRKRMRFSF
ncbi:hypothetical protein L1987_05327 [Smallanthus sonchifolius]|nr:hypothetical protein L1987_05327 [Smallanthus sonchifolius]